MRAGDDSVDALTDSFTTMAGSIQLIEKSIEEIKETGNKNNAQVVKEKCDVMHEKIQQAIVAFQFYDRLVQKLSHVSHSMDALGDLIGDHERIYNPMEWSALQEKIRSRYSMESERIMFDAYSWKSPDSDRRRFPTSAIYAA